MWKYHQRIFLRSFLPIKSLGRRKHSCSQKSGSSSMTKTRIKSKKKTEECDDNLKTCSISTCSEANRKDNNSGKEGDKYWEFWLRNMASFPLYTTYQEDEVSENLDSTYPSVVNILSDTVSEENKKSLELWKANMKAKLGEEGFLEFNKANLSRGIKFHGSIQRYLKDGSVEETEEGGWKSVRSVVSELTDVKLVESCLVHPILRYKGVVDCVARFRGTECAIEWKLSDKTKKNLIGTFDAPLQVCAYLGMLSWCQKPKFPTPVTNALVVVGYMDGSPASIFPMDADFCKSYWEQWLRRLQYYWIKRNPLT